MTTWFLLGVATGFPLWFSAGWVVRRDEHRHLARQRAPRCAPRCAHGCPGTRAATVTARAERAGEPAAVQGGAR